MSEVVTGVAIILTEAVELKVMAEVVANLTFDDLVKLAADRQPLITRSQFDKFIVSLGGEMINAGLLSEELEPTTLLKA